MSKENARYSHPLYKRWYSIMQRCYNKNRKNYKYWGGRGVIVAERWHDFWNFVEDVDNHLINGHLLYEGRKWQLDKDLKGGKIYSLENCVVISAEENNEMIHSRQQKNIMAIKNGDEIINFKSVAEASRQLNIPRGTVQKYLKFGELHSSGYLFKYCD